MLVRACVLRYRALWLLLLLPLLQFRQAYARECKHTPSCHCGTAEGGTTNPLNGPDEGGAGEAWRPG